MASNNNVLFSIGTEDKMDMSLDAIIEQNKKTGTGGKNRNPMARRKTTGTVQQRKRDLAKRASDRAAATRLGRVGNARGIISNNRVQNNTRRQTNNANNNNNNNGDGNWVKQQRQRKLAERLKLKAYKESRNEPAGSVPRHNNNSAGFRFDAPSFVSNGNNNNNNNSRFDRDRRRPTIKNLTVNVRSSAPAVDRSRVNTQNRQRNLVNNRRGIVSSNNDNYNDNYNNNYNNNRNNRDNRDNRDNGNNNNDNNGNNRRTTLNDRFGSGSGNSSGGITVTRGRGGRRTLTTSRNSLFANRNNNNDNNGNNRRNFNNNNNGNNNRNNNRRGGRRGGLFN